MVCRLILEGTPLILKACGYGSDQKKPSKDDNTDAESAPEDRELLLVAEEEVGDAAGDDAAEEDGESTLPSQSAAAARHGQMSSLAMPLYLPPSFAANWRARAAAASNGAGTCGGGMDGRRSRATPAKKGCAQASAAPCRAPRRVAGDEYPAAAAAGASSSSRQIYLTFPAESSFSEEDVTTHFRAYGPVQDVRIPYQQKRMFGFVTFVYPATVRAILAEGNPHYICGARVLVKPYREKGKHSLAASAADSSKSRAALERGEERSGSLRHGVRSGAGYDIRGSSAAVRLMAERRYYEDSDLEVMLEMERRRMAGLQLVD
eukprot:SM000396S15200  [mRNA]  locus=s396:51663:53258:+ [translate_table: standard]